VDKVTIHTLKKFKDAGRKIGMVTAYDATFARIFDDAGTDVMLVGDSLGMVIQGMDSTLPVTLEQMIYHSRMVTRAVKRAHVVGDMPFMSYQISSEEAVRNAGRLVAEGGVGSVKLEGGQEFSETISRIVRASIPVMGHLGLTPQSVHKMGGYVVQGRDEEAAKKLLEDAIALEQAGCYALVLEGVPMDLGRQITERLSIPTIGIGAGVHCDGQVLVCYDLLGMNPDFKPKFVKHYANLYGAIRQATETYLDEVRGQAFPDDLHSFGAKKPLRVVGGAPAAEPLPEPAVTPAAPRHAPAEPSEPGEEKIGPVYGVPV
jgi:3-methyl-2-oxobutanoate hydroxymethyltransferase